MKRFPLAALLLLILCLACACGPAPEEAEVVETEAEVQPPVPILVGTVVNTDNVNLRVSPSQEARIIDNVVAGTLLLVDDEESADGWYKVSARGDVAYVYADFLYVTQWHTGDQVTLGTVLNERDQVPVREKPSSSGKVLTKAVRYQCFVVLEENVSDKYIEVDYLGEPAYLPLDSMELETLCIEDALL